jgi:hypothetical protein
VVLVAARAPPPARIQAEVGWQARRDLRAIVTDAWQAMQAQFTQLRERAG